MVSHGLLLVLFLATLTRYFTGLAATSTCESIDGAFYFNGRLHLFFGPSFINFDKQKKEHFKGSIYEWGGLKGPIKAAMAGSHENSVYFFEWPRIFTYTFNHQTKTWISKMHPSFFKQSLDAACHRQTKSYFFRRCQILVWDNELHESDRLNTNSLGLPCDVDAAWEDNGDVIVLKGDKIWRWGSTVAGPQPFASYATLESISLCQTSEHRQTTSNDWFWETDDFDHVFQTMRRSDQITSNSSHLIWSNQWMRPFEDHKKRKDLAKLDATPCAVNTVQLHGLTCVNINAALKYKGLLYLFHGDSYITLDASYKEISRVELPDWGNTTTHVDAALSGFPRFFFNGRRYFSHYLDKRHGPYPTGEWDPMFDLGVDAAAEKNGTTYLFRGCSFKTFQSHRTVEASKEFQLGEYGLPCFLDAAWTEDEETMVIVKDNQFWKWGKGIEGPMPLDNLITVTSWRICGHGGGGDFE